MSRAENEERLRQAQFRRRTLVLGGVQAVGFGILISHLYALQVVQGRRYGSLSDRNRVSEHLLSPSRGSIFDRHGEPLVVGEEAYRAFLVPSLAGDVAEVVRLVARVVPGLTQHEIERLIARARRQRANEPILLASDLNFEQVGRLGLLAPQLPGVETERAERRRYVQGTVGGHVIGHIGNVAAVALDDDPVRQLPWVRTGRAGLELQCDERLSGRSGRVGMEVDARGRVVRPLHRIDPVRGVDVTSTLDIRFQASLEQKLAEHRCAAAVVMDVRNGEVLAMASVPAYDPGDVASGMPAERWRQFTVADDDPMINRAVAGLYPPGSTFKMVTALAALEAGVVDDTQRVHCRGALHYGGQRYNCWNRSGHGPMDLVGALRESCDVFFYEMARRVGIDRLAAMARRLGLGEVFDGGLPEQKAGIVPSRDWKRGRMGRSWLGGETVLAGVGQGYVLTTPLQLAVMTARIASGRAIEPHLVLDEDGGEGFAALVLGIAARHLDLVRRGMLEAVNAPRGTAARARIPAAGTLVAGKTGTAQVRRAPMRSADAPWGLRDHALFVAYAPAERPRYAVSVVVEHGGSGGAVAAPIAKEVIEEALTRDPITGRPTNVDGNDDRGQDRHPLAQKDRS